MADDVAEFLRARYAEARKAEMGKRAVRLEGPPCEIIRDSSGTYVVIGEGDSPFRPRMEIEDFNERYTDPAPDADALADLDAKLALVALHGRLGDDALFCITCDAPSGIPGDPHGCPTIRILSAPFATHPEYKETWRP